jgi:hypothetical protein
MRTVTITLCGADFAAEMANMRSWLDQHMFKPTKFTYKQDQEIITISVDFLSNHHAEAFKRHFNGHEPQTHFSLPNGLDRLGETTLDPLGQTTGERRTMEIPGTMAQACWWRLLAEEIRTEADNFSSASAKESMELAAQGWEQLAEEAGASPGEKRRCTAGLFRITLATNCSAHGNLQC